jgi:hypothetical protein
MASARLHRFCWRAAAWACVIAAAPAFASEPASPESRPLPTPAKATSGPEASPLAAEKAGLSGSAVQTIASLAGVVALIVVLGVTVRLVSRRSGGLMAAMGAGGRAPSGLLEVLGRYPVGRGSTLILLKMDRRVLLVSQGGGGKFGGASMTTLCEVTEPEDVASILLKVRDEEGDTLARKFQGMLTGADRAAAAALDEPEPAQKRLNVGPDSFDLAQARAAKAAPPIRSRLNTLRTNSGSGGGTR